MSSISKKLEEFLVESQKDLLKKDLILPIKVEKGILVGDVLIENDGSMKNIYLRRELIYREIFLNAAAIKIAILLALRKNPDLTKKIYQADLEFSKWFIDSKHFLEQYHKSLKSDDRIRSDILWTRYENSREQAKKAKKEVEFLCENRINN